MSDGRIYYAENDANYHIRFVGDVRVTLCTSLSKYIDHIFSGPYLKSLVLDLREAKAVDSTTLGFMAKVGLYAIARGLSPLIIVKDKSMIRLLDSMGFDELFEMVPRFPEDVEAIKELAPESSSSSDIRKEVIDAHQVLMSMNSKNMEAFSKLVSDLQKESENTNR
ncbi:MAG: anti-anti-sigma factor [Pseudomonadales bacterium]